MSPCAGESVVAWITDGSPVIFRDTHKLETETKPWFGHKRRFEGLVDMSVCLGSCSIPWQEGGHDAELEWVLFFDQPINEISDIDSNTSCILQGMIEGKNLYYLRGEDEIDWAPATIGNNVVATKGGNTLSNIGGRRVNLGQLSESTVLATMYLKYRKENGTLLSERVVPSTVLEKLHIVDYVKELSRRASEFGLQGSRVVNLGANGDTSGYVNDQKRQIGSFIKTFFATTEFERVLNGCRHRLIQKLIGDKEGMGRGEEATLEVYQRTDRTVKIGEAILKTE